MATASERLSNHTRAELVSLAKERGVPGASGLRKADLVEALAAEIGRVDAPHGESQSYQAPMAVTPGAESDAATLTSPEPMWCRVEWSVTSRTLKRAEKSLGRDWRSAEAFVAVHEAGGSGTLLVEEAVNADATVWYARLPRPAETTVRASVGVRTGEQSFVVATSPAIKTLVAATPRPVADALPGEILEELHRLHNEGDAFPFELGGELRLSGRTRPGTRVIAGERETDADPDGRFEFGFPVEAGRLVLPIEAVGPGGAEVRRGVVAGEFSLKVFEVEDNAAS